MSEYYSDVVLEAGVSVVLVAAFFLSHNHAVPNPKTKPVSKVMNNKAARGITME